MRRKIYRHFTTSDTEKENYRAMDHTVPFLARFIDRSTEHNKNASMTMVRKRYNGIVADMMENIL